MWTTLNENFTYTQRNIKMARNSNVRLKVEGVEDILKALRKADEDMQKELHDIVSEAAEIVFREADARVPILSGASRESLRIETGFTKSGLFYANVVVGNHDTAFYITFYELGTSRQPPRPFMRPALDSERSEIRNYMISRLRELIDKQGK